MTIGDTKRPAWSTCVLGGLALLAGGVLWQGVTAPRTALAQIPDSGEQRNQMITELRAANQKLEEVVRLLRDVRDAQVSEKKGKDTKPPAKP